MLLSMGSQRVRQDLAAEQQQQRDLQISMSWKGLNEIICAK